MAHRFMLLNSLSETAATVAWPVLRSNCRSAQAVTDGVREDPDQILIALHDAEHRTWRERGLFEHVRERFGLPVEIRCEAKLVARGMAPLVTLHVLGDQLAAHVRLEEHELLPLVEATLSDGELESLGVELVAAAR
ncbi:MAG: hypothetical protein ACJ77Z_09380 [Thermoleophilaceae bacterium]